MIALKEIKYKKISFRVDEETFYEIQNEADKEYLSMSAFIRKILMGKLQREV